MNANGIENVADLSKIGANWTNGCGNIKPVITQYVMANGRRVAVQRGFDLDPNQSGIRQLARDGVTYDNTGVEPLVILRYFGPEANPKAPKIGDYRKA